VTTKASEPLVFSILMNHHLCSSAEVNAVQDKIVTALAEME
jgi:D-alanyl-D-alanine carboxypeptidase